MDIRGSARRALWRLRLARVSLIWERLVTRGWAPVSVTFLILAVIFSDVLPAVSVTAHILVLGALGLGWICAIGWFLKAFRPPSESAVRRRLEEHNQLSHLPLETLRDRRLGGDGPIGMALWRLHQKRAAEALADLSTPPPRPMLARHDRFAVTAASLMVFLVSGFVGWGDMGPRIARAVTPFERFDETAFSVALWLTPPDYTGRPPVNIPVFLLAPDDTAEAAPSRFVVPEGTRLIGTITADRTPELSLNDTALPLDDIAGGFRLESDMGDGGLVQLSLANRVLGSWEIAVEADLPPEAAFANGPRATQRRALEVGYVAADDYGVTSLSLVIHPRDPAMVQQPPLVIDIPLDDDGRTESAGTEFHDLTAHPWAGLEVGLFLEAKDAAGQVGRSDVAEMLLPERLFTHPVAQRLVAARKVLLTRPGSEPLVSGELYDIGRNPAAFDHHTAVFLGLRIGANRLATATASDRIDEVAQLIWEMALAIEEGDLFLAEQQLRQAEEALQDALDDPETSVAELDALMQRFNEALQNYLSAMSERAQQGQQDELDLSPMLNGLEPTDLSRMIEQMRDMSRAGARDAAREMLNQMRSLLENLRMLEPGEETQNLAEAMRALSELQQLAQQQEALLNETMRRLQEQGQEADLSDLETEQQLLQTELTDLFERLQDAGLPIPPQLNQAGQNMNEASQQLGDGNGQQALGAEGRALDQLQQAGNALRGLVQEMAGQGMISNGPNGQGGPMQRDPLGRPSQADTSTIEVPDGQDLDRAWETLQELHRRAADPRRPELEIDYIDRLLDRF